MTRLNKLRPTGLILLLALVLMASLAFAQDGGEGGGVPIQPAPTQTPTPPPTTAPPTATNAPRLPTDIPTQTPTPTIAFTGQETTAEATTAAEPLLLRVVVDSAFIRAAPTLEADPTASGFEGDLLQAIGRNADGTWYEVARPYSNTRLGWIFNDVLARPNSDIWALPITSTIGVTGDVPVFDTGFAAFILGEVNLRAQPGLRADRVGIVPASVTVPILARNQDGSSLQINYNGQVGWVAAFLVRTNVDPLDIPQADNLPPLAFAKEQIPYEVQLAQVVRVQDYAEAQYAAAQEINNYWEQIINGTVVPCQTYPALATFPMSDADVRELPELRRFVPRMNTGVGLLNEARAAVTCGVLELDAVNEARADAINARLILENTLFQIERTEEIVSARRAPTPRPSNDG